MFLCMCQAVPRFQSNKGHSFPPVCQWLNPGPVSHVWHSWSLPPPSPGYYVLLVFFLLHSLSQSWLVLHLSSLLTGWLLKVLSFCIIFLLGLYSPSWWSYLVSWLYLHLYAENFQIYISSPLNSGTHFLLPLQYLYNFVNLNMFETKILIFHFKPILTVFLPSQ